MPLIGFKVQFAPLVESGGKRQTIRAYRKDGRDPKPGDRLYFWTGLRQKGARKLGEAKATSVLPIRIYRDKGGYACVKINGRDLTYGAMQGVARRDGFPYTFDFIRFFEQTHGLPFDGLVIKWGDIER